MARGTNSQQDLVDQFTHFFEILGSALESGDPQRFDGLLQRWADSLPQSDLEGGQSSLTLIIKELFLITHTVIIENLNAEDSLKALNSLLPLFATVFEKAATFEVNAKISYFKKELANMQTSMVKINRSKSGFITIAAHELKTPLTIIEGYSAMLANHLQRESSLDSFPPLIEGIKKGTVRLKGLIDDMIDVSLIDNNLLELNYQPYWLDRIIETITFEFARSLQERSIRLEISKFDGFSDINYGDPARVLQVFRNIISNAIKYTPDGGKIEISGRKLPGFIETSIRDTGIGIDAEDQRKIFEKFSQIGDAALHSSGKSNFKGGGPGLGLHIAKGIIDAHGGTIWADSAGYDEKNCPGTVVHVLFPIRDETIMKTKG